MCIYSFKSIWHFLTERVRKTTKGREIETAEFKGRYPLPEVYHEIPRIVTIQKASRHGKEKWTEGFSSS